MNRSGLISAHSGRPQTEPFGTLLWSTLFIAGLFIGVSLLSTPIPGINEPHYLAKARAFEDPTWCSRDFFLTSGNAHYCFFRLIGIFTRSFSLEAIALTGRVLSSIVLAIGWTMLGRSTGLTAVFRVSAAGIFAILSLAGSFSGEWLLGGFEAKVPAWGFALMAVSLWIRGQLRTCPGWMTAAGIPCGIACSLHPVVGGWVAVCICLVSIGSWFNGFRRHRFQRSALDLKEAAQDPSFELADSGTIKPLVGLFCFTFTTLTLSLPGLIPAIRVVLDDSAPLQDRQLASFFQVFWRLKHHLDPTEFLPGQWFYALSVGGAIFWSVRRLRGSLRMIARPVVAMDYLVAFFTASAFIALCGVLIGLHIDVAQNMSGWEWRAALLKFYPFRCFDALLPITAALLVSRIVQDDQSLGLHRWLTGSSRAPTGGLPRYLCLTAAVAMPLILAWRSREESPAGYTAEQYSEWRDACEWIRIHTPPEALILTPRESFAFKWFAERAEFVCYKDCPQDTNGILTWNKRLWMLHDWTLESSMDLLYSNSDLDVCRKETDCDFILTRILGPFEATPIWEGNEWKIYAVPKLRRAANSDSFGLDGSVMDIGTPDCKTLQTINVQPISPR